MSPIIKALINSVVVTSLFALFLGLSIGLITHNIGIGIGSCILAIIAQISVGSFINYNRERSEGKIYTNEVLEILKNAKEYRTNTQLSCAYCQMANTVPVSLELSNTFKCNACNQPNKVYIQLSTVRATQTLSKPVETEELDMDGPDIRQTTINDGVGISNE